MASSPFLPLLLLFATASLSAATDHIVGTHFGWNPNVNYSLWSNNQTFLVGDLISFRYQKNMYNVFEVNKTGYDNCTMDGLAGNWSSGKDFIPLNEAKTYYFICGNGFCFSGMKVSVVVRPLPSNDTAPSTARHGGSAAVRASAFRSASSPPAAAIAIAAAIVSLGWIQLGSGGI
ncbi:early nodulin-like protein 19 [Typha angustifolia]|uniref:early nodulin-like protein 19 n=1 Tax=Typha angustifolia TaxID=59011 RepID=UPI003C309646